MRAKWRKNLYDAEGELASEKSKNSDLREALKTAKEDAAAQAEEYEKKLRGLEAELAAKKSEESAENSARPKTAKVKGTLKKEEAEKPQEEPEEVKKRRASTTQVQDYRVFGKTGRSAVHNAIQFQRRLTDNEWSSQFKPQLKKREENLTVEFTYIIDGREVRVPAKETDKDSKSPWLKSTCKMMFSLLVLDVLATARYSRATREEIVRKILLCDIVQGYDNTKEDQEKLAMSVKSSLQNLKQKKQTAYNIHSSTWVFVPPDGQSGNKLCLVSNCQVCSLLLTSEKIIMSIEGPKPVPPLTCADTPYSYLCVCLECAAGYVGATGTGRKRFSCHSNESNHSFVYLHCHRCGTDGNFGVILLERCQTGLADLFAMELKWMFSLRTAWPNGMNSANLLWTKTAHQVIPRTELETNFTVIEENSAKSFAHRLKSVLSLRTIQGSKIALGVAKLLDAECPQTLKTYGFEQNKLGMQIDYLQRVLLKPIYFFQGRAFLFQVLISFLIISGHPGSGLTGGDNASRTLPH